MNDEPGIAQDQLSELAKALASAFPDHEALLPLAGYVFGVASTQSPCSTLVGPSTDSSPVAAQATTLPGYVLPSGDRIELSAPYLVEFAARRGDIPSLLLVATKMRSKDRGLARVAANWNAQTETELQARLAKGNRFKDSGTIDRDSCRVCRVEIDNQPLGTGFLVASDLVITNWHVVKSILASVAPRVVPSKRIAFRFDYRNVNGQVSKGTTYVPASGDNVVAFSPEARLDYVLIRLSGDAGMQPPLGLTGTGARGWLRATRFVLNTAVCGHAYLIQHPQGKPLLFDDGAVLSRYLFDGRKVLYEIDTLDGSSGSPCILLDGHVFALHRGAEDGGNEGVFFPSIAEHCLREFGVDLFAVAAPPAIDLQAARLPQVADAKKWREPIRQYLAIAPALVKKLAISRGYVRPSASVRRPDGSSEQVPDLVEWLLNACRSTATTDSLWLILGGYGRGKSSLLQIVGEILAKETLGTEMSATIPIYCRMEACRSRGSLTAGISYYLTRYGINVEEDALRELFNDRQQQVVLLLDGLDEFAERVDYSRLGEALQLIWDVRGSSALRVMLTCRDTFFPSEDDVAIVRADHLVRLEPFSEDQIREYLSIWSPPLNAAYQILARDDYLRNVCQSPMHLFLFCNFYSSLPAAERDCFNAGEMRVRRIDLYRSFVRETLAVAVDVTKLWSIADRLEFLKDLAFHWHDNSVDEWSDSDLHDFIANYLSARRLSGGGNSGPLMEDLSLKKRTSSIFNCSFFVRIENRFRFTHKSFQEYFIALSLADEIRTGKFSKWQTPLYNEIYFFGAELLRPDRKALDAVFTSGQLRTQGNFLATVYNVPSLDIDEVMRREVERGRWATIRQVATQGLAYRDATRSRSSAEQQADAEVALIEDVRAAMRAYKSEPNTIVCATLRRVISWALNKGVRLESAELDIARQVTTEIGLLQQADAREILDLGTDTRIIPLYRRAMMQEDHRWPSVVGGIYLLSVIQDDASLEEMKRVVDRSKHPEVKAAYEECASWRPKTVAREPARSR